MKKVFIFLGGVVFTLLTLGGFAYYMFNGKITRGSTEEAAAITEEEVDEALRNKIIDRIEIAQYDSLTNTMSKKTIVTFWASWCGSCIKEIPTLQKYAKERDMELVYLNFDKLEVAQNKVVLDKMKKLNIEKTYQLLGDKKILDPMNFRMLSGFLEDRDIEIDSVGLPLNIVYEKGKYNKFFGPRDIQRELFNGLDRYLEKK